MRLLLKGAVSESSDSERSQPGSRGMQRTALMAPLLRRPERSAERVSAPPAGCAASSQMAAQHTVSALTAADSTATVELTDSCTFVHPQSAAIGLRRRGCAALRRESANSVANQAK